MTRTCTTTARRLLAATTAGVVSLAGLGVGPAAAAGIDEPIVDGLVGPLAIDIDPRGTTLVAETFRGAVSHVSTSGEVSEVVLGEPVVAAAHGVAGNTVYTISNDQGSLLKRQTRSGRQDVLADLLAYEQSTNPDQVNTYGLVGASQECVTAWETLRQNTPPDAPPEAQLPPAVYTGADIAESNPYAIAVTATGTYVADAAANAILRVDRRGRVSTVAVLPPQPATPPAGFFTESLGLPECEGQTYVFEPVPTDVEVHGRTLYVSTLPGGPEDPSLGARGSVYTVDRFTGTTTLVGGGLLGATDVAVSPNRTVYATELFANRVSQVTPSGPITVAELPTPAALEWTRRQLIVAYDVFDSGKLTRVTP
jgi:hypothetical protein